MRKPVFWVSEQVRHNWAVKSQMMANYRLAISNLDSSGVVLSIK